MKDVLNTLRLLVLLLYQANACDVRTSVLILLYPEGQEHVALSGDGEAPKHFGNSITARLHV